MIRDSKVTKQVRETSGWGIGIGIIMVILGLIAIARPLYATIASTIAFGWLFVIAGIAGIAYAFESRGTGHLVWKRLIGILDLIAGFYLIASPIKGAIAVTLVL